MNEALKLSGLQASKLGNVYTLQPYQEKTEVNYYRPKFRKVEYIVDLLRQAFPNEKFGYQSSKTGNLKTDTESTEGATKYADHASDLVVYRTSPDNHKTINSFITMIDTKNVTLQVVGGSYEYSDTKNKGSAINVFGELVKNKLGIDLGVSLTGVGSVFKLAGVGITALLKIVDSDSRFKSIAKPSLLIDSGQEATFNSGSDVPVLSGTTTSNGTVTQNVDYRSSGVLLTVKPTALQDVINIDVKQEFSSFMQNKTSTIETPILNKRLIQTSLTVQNGDFIVLAGLSEARTQKGRQSIGAVQLGTTTDTVQAETLLLLQVTEAFDTVAYQPTNE